VVQVRVRAVANVMGLRRGDEGDVETGSAHIDAMINAGYLQVIEYLPDPIPIVTAVQFAHPNSFGDAVVVETKLGKFETPPPTKVEPGSTLESEEVKPRGKANSSKSRPRPSRSRSAAARRPAGDAGDGSDAQPSVGDRASGHGEPTGPASDEQAGGEA
jgi:hypothetical protein